jgi:hypothetical protein
MAYIDVNALKKQLPDRKFKLFVVGIGLAFWMAWGISLFVFTQGHPLGDIATCGPMDQTGIFWECASGKVHTLVASILNALIVLTLAMPAFVVAANFDAAALPLAVPGLLFHVIGLPAGAFVLVRSLRRLAQKAQR